MTIWGDREMTVCRCLFKVYVYYSEALYKEISATQADTSVESSQ